MNKLFILLLLGVFALFQSVAFSLPQAVSAHSRPDTVWLGPLPVIEFCPAEYIPVRDAQGTVYANECEALKAGVRVTWNVM